MAHLVEAPLYKQEGRGINSRWCHWVFFSDHNPFGRSMVLGSTQPVTEMRKGKGKAVPLQVWSGPEGSRKLRFPDFMTLAQDRGKLISLTHQPSLPPGNAPGTHFC